jgi:hypothetical protein
VILLWDSLHDLEMIDGFAYNNLIRIGWCHSDDEQIQKIYRELFDIVILNDWWLDIVNTIIRKISV